MTGRHFEHTCIVTDGIWCKIERIVRDAIGQCLAIDFNRTIDFGHVRIVDCANALALNSDIIDVENAATHLHAITWKTDHAFDVIDVGVAWQLEDHDITALGLSPPNTTGEEVQTERQRIARIAIGVFRNEQIIAFQQRWAHGAGRNAERLEKQAANDQCQQESLHDNADGFAKAA
ncbi:hypothetical protein FQZ97_739810 [compost metagenome]